MLELKIELEGFEEPLFAQVDIKGFEEPLFLEKIRAFEEPLFIKVRFESLKKGLEVHTEPMRR